MEKQQQQETLVSQTKRFRKDLDEVLQRIKYASNSDNPPCHGASPQ